MRPVSYSIGTAPASLVVVQGVGRALNPTARSGKPTKTNLSAHSYDNTKSRHNGGVSVNSMRTEAFDTPVKVWEKNTGWLTVAGGKDGLTITFAPDAIVKYAEVVTKGQFVVDKVTESGVTLGHFEEDTVEVISGITLKEYMETYC